MKVPFPVNRIEIDLEAFRFNLQSLQSVLKPKTQMLLVVKSDAYGHGMIPVAREAVRSKRVGYFGVSSPAEAFRLREAGIRTPILILGVTAPSEMKEVIRKGITSTVSSFEEARELNRTARSLRRRAKVHVELDTGMGRLGIWCREGLRFLYRVHRLSSLILEGAYTHFPSADERDPGFSKSQIEIFGKAMELTQELFGKPLCYLHMANSIGLLSYQDSHFNLVRPGILAYGIQPVSQNLPIRLKPVLALKSRICLIKSTPKGRTISYARSFVTRKPTRIATVPIGYASGIPYGLSNRGWVLIRGHRFPMVGRITMDHLMVDIGGADTIKNWDEVVLLGSSGKESIGAEEVASLSGTIPYDVVTRLSTHIPRIYIKDTGHKTQDPRHRTQDPRPKTQDHRPETRLAIER